MSDALVPVIAGRPPIIVIEGCTIYLSLHDVEYFRMKRVLTAAMLAEHPDTFRRDASGHKARARTTEFRAALARLRAWQIKQRTIYWALDQMPPDWPGIKEAPPGVRIRPAGRLSGSWRPWGNGLTP